MLDLGQPISIKFPFTLCCCTSQSHYLRSCMKHCTVVPLGLRNMFPRMKTQLVLRRHCHMWRRNYMAQEGQSQHWSLVCHQFQSTRGSKLQSSCPFRQCFLHNTLIFYAQSYIKRAMSAPSSTRRSEGLNALSVQCEFHSFGVCTDFHTLECAFDYMTETCFSKSEFLVWRMGSHEH